VSFQKNEPTRKNSIPIMMEFPVNPELTPFLVSTMRATLWVNRAPNGIVRAATRKMENLPDYFLEVARSVTSAGRKYQWGNVHPLTKEGIQGAIEHVRSYDLNELELLANPKMNWEGISPEWKTDDKSIPVALFGLPLQPATWLPTDTVLVIPRDREFVGFVLLFQERIASVVHNASRGIGVATSWDGEAHEGVAATGS
jgi:hypothetical protein